MEMALRMIALVTTVGVLLVFLFRLRLVSLHEWSLEQRSTVVLLVLLIFYNSACHPT